jgi:hypothetical protein
MVAFARKAGEISSYEITWCKPFDGEHVHSHNAGQRSITRRY